MAARIQDEEGAKGGSSSRRFCPRSLDGAVASLGPACGINDLNVAVKKLSRWSTFRESEKYLEWQLDLKRILVIFGEYKVKVVNAESPMAKVAVIHELERELSSSPGVSSMVVKLFARALDSYMMEVPSQSSLKQFRENLIKLGNSTIGTPFKVMDWANFQANSSATSAALLQAGRTDEEVSMLADTAEQKKFVSTLSREFEEVALQFTSSFVLHPQPGLPSNRTCLLGAFLNVFKEALDKHNFKWFSTNVHGELHVAGLFREECAWFTGFKINPDVLGWTKMGLLVQQLVRAGLVDNPKFTSMIAIEVYMGIGLVLIPQFMQELTMLSATLESRMQELEFMKTKAIAAGVSLFITGVPIVAKLIYRATGFEEAS